MGSLIAKNASKKFSSLGTFKVFPKERRDTKRERGKECDCWGRGLEPKKTTVKKHEPLLNFSLYAIKFL
jgi:hypothetical protein